MRMFIALIVAIIVMAVLGVQGIILLGDEYNGILTYVLFFVVVGIGGLIVKLISGEKNNYDD